MHAPDPRISRRSFKLSYFKAAAMNAGRRSFDRARGGENESPLCASEPGDLSASIRLQAALQRVADNSRESNTTIILNVLRLTCGLPELS